MMLKKRKAGIYTCGSRFEVRKGVTPFNGVRWRLYVDGRLHEMDYPTLRAARRMIATVMNGGD